MWAPKHAGSFSPARTSTGPTCRSPTFRCRPSVLISPGARSATRRTARVCSSAQLQFEVQRRLSAGFLIQAEYSYTRSRDNASTTGGAQNPNNEMADYGNTDSVPRQVLVFNYLYDLPVGRGRKFDVRNRILAGVGGG